MNTVFDIFPINVLPAVKFHGDVKSDKNYQDILQVFQALIDVVPETDSDRVVDQGYHQNKGVGELLKLDRVAVRVEHGYRAYAIPDALVQADFLFLLDIGLVTYDLEVKAAQVAEPAELEQIRKQLRNFFHLRYRQKQLGPVESELSLETSLHFLKLALLLQDFLNILVPKIHLCLGWQRMQVPLLEKRLELVLQMLRDIYQRSRVLLF